MAKNKDVVSKIVTVLAASFLLLALGFMGSEFYFGPEKRFVDSWGKDFQTLLESKKLHEGFGKIKRIEFISTSPKLEKAYKNRPINISESPSGSYELQIFADEIPGGGIIVQYDLIDLASGNTIQEVGRTFPHKL